MPMQKTRARLRWRGKDSVQDIIARLRERERMLLILPAGFHHAVMSSLPAGGDVDAPIDVLLDDAAFGRIAAIRGLRALAELREPLAEADMEVWLRTPPPQLRFVPRDRAARRSHRRYIRPSAVFM